jgi:hypothetical protein
MLAKVRRNVCGLHGRLVLIINLRIMILTPLVLMSHKRSLSLCCDSHSFIKRSARSPNGAKPSLLPLHFTLISLCCQSMFLTSIFATSCKRRPLSANSEMIALSRRQIAASMTQSTCSSDSDGSIFFSTFGASTSNIGLSFASRP